MAVDLGFELGPSAAVPAVETLELTLRSRELFGGVRALPVDLLVLLSDLVEDRVASASALVESERLGGGALEGAGGAFGRSGGVGLAKRCFAFERSWSAR